MSTSSTDSTLALLKQLVLALDEKKAEDLRVLYVGAKSTITDYLVLATGNSEPHLRSLRIELEKVFDSHKAPIAGMDVGNYGSGWLVVDAYQIMAHLFTAEQRGNYALEKLWKDAKDISVKDLVAEPKVAAEPEPKPKAVKKTVKKAAAVEEAPVKAVAAKKTVVKKTAAKPALKAPAQVSPARKTLVKKAAVTPAKPVVAKKVAAKPAVVVKKTAVKKVAAKKVAKPVAKKKAK